MGKELNSGTVVLSLCVLLACFFAGHSSSVRAGGGDGKNDVEDTVRKEVAKAIKGNPGIGAALVRLVFHDCWVNGCDGSVLLEKTPFSRNTETEKNAENNIGLDGFDVIDAIKDQLGDGVSCADIVVMAARDATGILSRGNIVYAVETGRKDGVVSSAAAADATLPASTFDFRQLRDNFAAKKFTREELVALSGAHSVGVARFSSFQDRLDSSTASPIDGSYLKALAADVKALKLRQGTPNPAELNNIRDMGTRFQSAAGYDATGVDTAATGVLDNSYYAANLQNMVLFKSDWELRNDTTGASEKDLRKYSNSAAKWNKDFAAAMAKLSELPAEGSHFEIRKNCRITNKKHYE